MKKSDSRKLALQELVDQAQEHDLGYSNESEIPKYYQVLGHKATTLMDLNICEVDFRRFPEAKEIKITDKLTPVRNRRYVCDVVNVNDETITVKFEQDYIPSYFKEGNYWELIYE